MSSTQTPQVHRPDATPRAPRTVKTKRTVQVAAKPPRVALPRPHRKHDTLVLSGGGVRGVAMLGAVHRLRSAGMLADVDTVVGTSAGAIVGALVATKRCLRAALEIIGSHGYTPDFDFAQLPKEFGLDSGKCIDSMASSLLQESYALTFDQVRSKFGIRFIVCVTNLTTRSAEFLGPDTHPTMPISLAIRMSCSVPLYFTAVRYQDQLYVDGSIANNFPCNWALDNGSKRVFGITSRSSSSTVSSLEAMLGALVESVAASQPCPRADVLHLDLPGVQALHFGASHAEIVRLFALGADQAQAFVQEGS